MASVDPKLDLEKFFAKAQELDIVIFMHPIGFTQGDRLMDHYFNNVIGNPLDTTIAGSRSAVAPLYLWYRLRTLGRDGCRCGDVRRSGTIFHFNGGNLCQRNL